MAEDRLVVVGRTVLSSLERFPPPSELAEAERTVLRWVRAAEHRRGVTELLARQLEVERLTGELTPGARCLTVGVAHALATRPNPIPAVGMVVPPHL